mgnify:CR=1 FL=1
MKILNNKLNVFTFTILFLFNFVLIFFALEKNKDLTNYKIRLYSDFDKSFYQFSDSLNNRILNHFSKDCILIKNKKFPNGQGFGYEIQCEENNPNILEIENITLNYLKKYILDKKNHKINSLKSKIQIINTQILKYDEYSIKHDLVVHSNKRRDYITSKSSEEKKLEIALNEKTNVLKDDLINKFDINIIKKIKKPKTNFAIIIIFSLILTILIFLSLKSLNFTK